MKKLGKLFLALAAAVCFLATGCSFKIVGWKDHIEYTPEYQKSYDKNYQEIYD